MKNINIKAYATMIMTFICIVGALALAFVKDVDITTLLPTILGIYVGAKAAVAGNGAWAASKDMNCDTASIIKDTDNI